MILGLKVQALHSFPEEDQMAPEDTAADHVEEVGMRTKEVDLMDDSMAKGRVELLGLLHEREGSSGTMEGRQVGWRA